MAVVLGARAVGDELQRQVRRFPELRMKRIRHRFTAQRRFPRFDSRASHFE
jgi:hypothetical protein